MDSAASGQPTSTFAVRFAFYRLSCYIEYNSSNPCCLCYTSRLPEQGRAAGESAGERMGVRGVL